MSVLLNASVIRDADGQYVSSRFTVFDITERNRAKQDLAKQTTILQSVLNSMGEGVVEADMDRFVLWNPAADRLLRLGTGPPPTQRKEYVLWALFARPNHRVSHRAAPAGASHSGRIGRERRTVCAAFRKAQRNLLKPEGAAAQGCCRTRRGHRVQRHDRAQAYGVEDKTTCRSTGGRQ